MTRARRRASWASFARPDSAKCWTRLRRTRDMRLVLLALFGLGAAALEVTLLAWLAERQLHRTPPAVSFADVSKVPAADVALVLGTAPIGPEGVPDRYFFY